MDYTTIIPVGKGRKSYPDKEKGLAMAIAKKLYGCEYHGIFKKWVD